MTRLLTPAEAEQYMQRLAEQHALVPPYRTQRKKALNPQSTRTVDVKTWEQPGWVVFQLGVFLPSQRETKVWDADKAKKALDQAVWSALVERLGAWGLHAYKGSQRERIEKIVLVRLAPIELFEHDNLPWNLKGVLDRVCAWIEHGNRVLTFNKRERLNIGRSDDKLIQTKGRRSNPIRYRVAQEQCGDRAGVQIWLKIRQAGRRSTVFTTPIALRRRKRKRAFRSTTGARPCVPNSRRRWRS